MAGIWNIIVGIVMIVGGLSGQLALIGTNSGMALAGLGGLILVIGIGQMIRSGGGNNAF